MVTRSHGNAWALILDSSSDHLPQWRFSWSAFGAAVGFCAGIGSALIAAGLTVMSWVTGPRWHHLPLQRGGTLLFALTIPLLIFGAHCLDLLDRPNGEANR
jgi:hypothetical protein